MKAKKLIQMKDDKADPKDLRLGELYEKNGNELRVDDVVEDAKDPNSPLYDEFDWDVNKAANAHWREIARRLIRSFVARVVVTDLGVINKHPKYVRNAASKPREQGYKKLSDVREDKALAQATLRGELERARSILERMRTVAVALGLGDQIDSIRRELDLILGEVRKVA